MLVVREAILKGLSSYRAAKILKEKFGDKARGPRTVQEWVKKCAWDQLLDQEAAEGVAEAIENLRYTQDDKDYTQTLQYLNAVPRDVPETEDERDKREKEEREADEQIRAELRARQRRQYEQSSTLRNVAIALVQKVITEVDENGIPVVDKDGNTQINAKFEPKRVAAAAALYQVATQDCRKLEEILERKFGEKLDDTFSNEGFAMLWRRTKDAMDYSPIPLEDVMAD